MPGSAALVRTVTCCGRGVVGVGEVARRDDQPQPVAGREAVHDAGQLDGQRPGHVGHPDRGDQAALEGLGAVGRHVVQLGEQDELAAGAGGLGGLGGGGVHPHRQAGRADQVGGRGQRRAGPADERARAVHQRVVLAADRGGLGVRRGGRSDAGVGRAAVHHRAGVPHQRVGAGEVEALVAARQRRRPGVGAGHVAPGPLRVVRHPVAEVAEPRADVRALPAAHVAVHPGQVATAEVGLGEPVPDPRVGVLAGGRGGVGVAEGAPDHPGGYAARPQAAERRGRLLQVEQRVLLPLHEQRRDV